MNLQEKKRMLSVNALDPDIFSVLHRRRSCVVKEVEVLVYDPPVMDSAEGKYKEKVYVKECEPCGVSSWRFYRLFLGDKTKYPFDE